VATLPIRRALVRLDDTPTGMALIWLDGNGRNAIAVVPGANARLRPDHLNGVQAPGPEDVVLVSLEIPLATAVAAAQWARGGGARLVVDPAPAPDRLPEVLWQADALVPNRGEAERLQLPMLVDMMIEREANAAMGVSIDAIVEYEPVPDLEVAAAIAPGS
jgi:ribokinase